MREEDLRSLSLLRGAVGPSVRLDVERHVREC